MYSACASNLMGNQFVLCKHFYYANMDKFWLDELLGSIANFTISSIHMWERG